MVDVDRTSLSPPESLLLTDATLVLQDVGSLLSISRQSLPSAVVAAPGWAAAVGPELLPTLDSVFLENEVLSPLPETSCAGLP